MSVGKNPSKDDLQLYAKSYGIPLIGKGGKEKPYNQLRTEVAEYEAENDIDRNEEEDPERITEESLESDFVPISDTDEEESEEDSEKEALKRRVAELEQKLDANAIESMDDEVVEESASTLPSRDEVQKSPALENVAIKKRKVKVPAKVAEMDIPDRIKPFVSTKVKTYHETEKEIYRKLGDMKDWVRTMIPYSVDDKPGATLTVGLNGAQFELPKNVYLDIPEPLANIIENSTGISLELEVLEAEFAIDNNDDKREILA